MTETKGTIPVDTSAVQAMIAKIEAMASYFTTARDDDPAKVAMAAFGEIDCERHIHTKVDFPGGQVVVTVTPVPELKRIMDLVPG